MQYAQRTGASVHLVGYPDSAGEFETMLEEAVSAFSDMVKASEGQGIAIPQHMQNVSGQQLVKIYRDMIERAYVTAEALNGIDAQVASAEFNSTVRKLFGRAGSEREQFTDSQLGMIKPDMHMHVASIEQVFPEFSSLVPGKPLYERLGSSVREKVRLCDVK